ncbi:MAG: tRNA lysidine(34) synthetase TilS [Candidatus Omnitrophota bacterium]
MKRLSCSAFLKRVRDTVKQYDMLDDGDRVLAAVSGGADSVCLLKALLDIRRSVKIDVIVGNMDHCLRGAESARDSSFVKELCGKLGVGLVYKKIDVRPPGKKGASLEERAREKRYAFFRESALREGCNVIATGHTMDDQAETVLMRIIYGSSLSGITGIPPVREDGEVRIIRPLIRVERREILDFLEGSGLGYVEDSTNRDVRLKRNSIRREILPFLEKYNPRIKRSLVNISDTLREDLIFLKGEMSKNTGKYADVPSETPGIKVKDIILQQKTVRKEIFKELFRKAGGDIKGLTYRHWMDLDCFLRTAEKNSSLDLPGGIKAVKDNGRLTFMLKSRDDSR